MARFGKSHTAVLGRESCTAAGWQSKLEPRWLADVPVCGPRWAVALDALTSLLTRSSALESMLEVRLPLRQDSPAAGSCSWFI